MEMLTVNADGREVNRAWFCAEGEGIRMAVAPSTDDPELSAIFRDQQGYRSARFRIPDGYTARDLME